MIRMRPIWIMFFMFSPLTLSTLMILVLFYYISILNSFIFAYYIFTCSICICFVQSIYFILLLFSAFNVILLTSSVTTLCASFLNLYFDFSIDILSFKISLRFFLSVFTSTLLFLSTLYHFQVYLLLCNLYSPKVYFLAFLHTFLHLFLFYHNNHRLLNSYIFLVFIQQIVSFCLIYLSIIQLFFFSFLVF